MTSFEVTEGVYGIDVGLFDSGFVSVYLFDDESPTLVDAGTATTADRVVEALDERGVSPGKLDNLVLSHIHADHSGGASTLVEENDDLDVYIHGMTAPHLIDPSGLIESSRQAMGEHFEQIGEQGPIPEENVATVTDDGASVSIGENTLELIYAPGHSPDHFAVWNPERELLFAAECLGVYLERADEWLPPSTLPNFDVELIEEAIDRLRRLDPDTIVFPHYGVWPGEPEEAFERAETELHRFDERILEFHDETGSIEETRRAVVGELVSLSPAYDEQVESFYARLVTDGYLEYHGLR